MVALTVPGHGQASRFIGNKMAIYLYDFYIIRFSVTFSFPRDANIKEQWLRLIGRDVNTVINYERVCAEHFNKNEIILRGNKKCLLANAIPCKNLPICEPVKAETSASDDGHTGEPVRKKLRFSGDCQMAMAST